MKNADAVKVLKVSSEMVAASSIHITTLQSALRFEQREDKSDLQEHIALYRDLIESSKRYLNTLAEYQKTMESLK